MINFVRSPFLVVVLVILLPYVIAGSDPYEILGIGRDASDAQIKKAYRDLAKKLHPDSSKLNEKDANIKFIELNKAYDLLKDPARKSSYDNRNARGHSHNQKSRESRANEGFRTFQFSPSVSQLRKRSITSQQYYNHYLEESKFKPFLIFFYSETCSSCGRLESGWISIIDQMAKYNIGSFTIDIHREFELTYKLGIDWAPQIACLIDGELEIFEKTVISLPNLVKFIRSLLPDNLVQQLRTDEDQERFLALSPSQNKLSAIIYHDQDNLQLRYLILAFEIRMYYRFGQISTKNSGYMNFASRYKTGTHLLVFDENLSQPRIELGLDTSDYSQLKKKLLRWPFLQLPKLSSQRIFDDLCIYSLPKDGDKKQKRLCVILFAADMLATKLSRNKMMEFISQNQLKQDAKVTFAFLDPTTQSEFIQSLLSETSHTHPLRKDESIDSSIILIVRHPNDNRKAVYKWLKARWIANNIDELDRAKIELHSMILDYKNNFLEMGDKLLLSTLKDEDSFGIIQKIGHRIASYVSRMSHYVVSRDSISTVIVLTIIALITSLIVYRYYMKSNFQNDFSDLVDSTLCQPSKVQNTTQPSSADDEIKIMELKAETYFGLVRLLKPGCRSIILLLDQETKEKLLPKFKEMLKPFRKHKSLLFGYLCLDKNLEWYKSLLEQVLGVDELIINKKNCIGTVLTLNGFKKDLRIYHSKHHEIDSFDDDSNNDGSFLGLNEDDIEAKPIPTNRSSETECTVENLLDRLPTWLDKTFDGLTKRYPIDDWPDEMK